VPTRVTKKYVVFHPQSPCPSTAFRVVVVVEACGDEKEEGEGEGEGEGKAKEGATE